MVRNLRLLTFCVILERSGRIPDPENHCHMVALYAVWYNFIRIHKTLRVTPAMEAGVMDRLIGYEELVGIWTNGKPIKGRSRRREAF